MNINEIYIEAHHNSGALERLITPNEFVCCKESVDRTITLIQLLAQHSITIQTSMLLKDDTLFELLKLTAALHFEAGRLYGRQEIVDETLREIK